MRIAIHQPNFIPWFPYFEKMAQCDIFVLLVDCQFEKNNFTNRVNIDGKWWTKPVKHGLVPILDKYYTDGQNLVDVNLPWIVAIAKTLSINVSKIKFEVPSETGAKGTARIAEICKSFGADEYLANWDAPKKYLDIKMLEEAGIKFIPFKSNHQKHIFKMFDEYGIEKTINILNEKVKRELQETGKKDAEGSQKVGKGERREVPARTA